MKNILSYISAFILILLSATSCEDNENWKIVTEAQPGTYIVGTATIFSGEATSSALKPIKLDGTDSKNDVIGIYTWLKAEGEFNIYDERQPDDYRDQWSILGPDGGRPSWT